MAWAFTKDGSYLVNTAYMIRKSRNLGLFHRAWMKIKSLNVSPKMRHFLWRVCSGHLSVKVVLKHRHILDGDTCPLCNEVPETIWPCTVVAFEGEGGVGAASLGE